MREVKYKRYWYFNDRPDEMEGKLADLVLDILYLMDNYGVIPPFDVLNDVLFSGGSKGSMNPFTKWDSFTITQQEYDELVDYFINMSVVEARKHHPYIMFDKVSIDSDLIKCYFEHISKRDLIIPFFENSSIDEKHVKFLYWHHLLVAKYKRE